MTWTNLQASTRSEFLLLLFFAQLSDAEGEAHSFKVVVASECRHTATCAHTYARIAKGTEMGGNRNCAFGIYKTVPHVVHHLGASAGQGGTIHYGAYIRTRHPSTIDVNGCCIDTGVTCWSLALSGVDIQANKKCKDEENWQPEQAGLYRLVQGISLVVCRKSKEVSVRIKLGSIFATVRAGRR